MNSLSRLTDALGALVRVPGLTRHEDWSRERLERYQAEALHRMIAHVLASSPFLASLYRAAKVTPSTPLAELPTLDKSTLMRHFDELVTDRRLRLRELEAHLAQLTRDELHLGEYRVVSTSGTSGERALVVYDRSTWATALASGLRAGRFMGIRQPSGRRLRQATVSSASPHHLGSRYASMAGAGLTICLQLDPRTRLEQLCAALDDFRPDVLACYPSIGEQLALAQLDGMLDIAPQAVVTTGEVRTPLMRQRIEQAFGAAPFDVYASCETTLGGVECSEHRGIHLLEDLVIFEIVDAHDRPVAPGEQGARVLVTNLANRTLPLIRYALSDQLVLAPTPCPCGRPFRVVSAITGRSEDALRFRARSGATLEVSSFVLRSPIAATPGVRQFRLLNEPACLRVEVVLAPGCTSEPLVGLQRALEERLRSEGVAAPAVRVEVVTTLPREGVGAKLKVVEERSGLLLGDPGRFARH